MGPQPGTVSDAGIQTKAEARVIGDAGGPWRYRAHCLYTVEECVAGCDWGSGHGENYGTTGWWCSVYRVGRLLPGVSLSSTSKRKGENAKRDSCNPLGQS